MTTHDLGLKTSIQTFDAFVRCMLMGNQPWPQFKNGIRERSILLYHRIHIVSFRKSITIPIYTSERTKKLLTESSTKRHVLYDKYWGKYPLSVECSDVHHVFSNLFP